MFVCVCVYIGVVSGNGFIFYLYLPNSFSSFLTSLLNEKLLGNATWTTACTTKWSVELENRVIAIVCGQKRRV